MRTNFKLFSFVLLGLFFSTQSSLAATTDCDKYQQQTASVELKKDDPSVIEEWKALVFSCAESGDEELRMFIFGWFLNGMPGLNVEKDVNEAVRWIEMSAREGSIDHQNILVNLYTNKDITEQLDLSENRIRYNAYKWYYSGISGYPKTSAIEKIREIEEKMSDEDKASAIAEGVAMYLINFEREGFDVYRRLGIRYFEGEFVKKDLKLAHSYLLKAADLGDSYAQNILGNHYAQGIGYEGLNIQKGIYWYEKSAAQENYYALFNLGKMYLNGDKIEKNVTKAMNYIVSAADKGNDDAKVMLGEFYVNGTYVDKDPVKAFLLFTRASKGSNSYAKYYLGHCFNYGVGTTQDKEAAYEWYLKSAKAGNVDAQFSMGVVKENGSQEAGIIKNVKEAVEWYQKASDQGHGKAQYNLGLVVFRGGSELERDLYKAYELIFSANVDWKHKEKILSDIMKQMNPEDLSKVKDLLSAKK